jgi:subfamily B ATP-binding cassette protein MsbA
MSILAPKFQLEVLLSESDFKVYVRLISYLKSYWGVALFVLLGFGINAATEVSVAKLLKYIIDAIQNGSRENLDWFQP